jgi:hypothetical protein
MSENVEKFNYGSEIEIIKELSLNQRIITPYLINTKITVNGWSVEDGSYFVERNSANIRRLNFNFIVKKGGKFKFKAIMFNDFVGVSNNTVRLYGGYSTKLTTISSNNLFNAANFDISFIAANVIDINESAEFTIPDDSFCKFIVYKPVINDGLNWLYICGAYLERSV